MLLRTAGSRSSSSRRAVSDTSGGDKRDDIVTKIFAAEKIVICRTICMGPGPDASNASIAVPAVQSS